MLDFKLCMVEVYMPNLESFAIAPWSSLVSSVGPDTPCPLVIALVPLKCSALVQIYNFLIGCPSPKRNALVPLPLRNEAYMPVVLILKRTDSERLTVVISIHWYTLIFFRIISMLLSKLIAYWSKTFWINNHRFFSEPTLLCPGHTCKCHDRDPNTHSADQLDHDT